MASELICIFMIYKRVAVAPSRSPGDKITCGDISLIQHGKMYTNVPL